MDKVLTALGSKAYQRTDTEWRIKAYSDWRRTIKGPPYMIDADDIEWRFVGGQPFPAAVIEVTRVDNEIPVGAKYLQAIISRFEERDSQAKVARKLASLLKVEAYITLFRHACTEFWVYNLSRRTPWVYYKPDEYQAFLRLL